MANVTVVVFSCAIVVARVIFLPTDEKNTAWKSHPSERVFGIPLRYSSSNIALVSIYPSRPFSDEVRNPMVPAATRAEDWTFW